MPSTPTPPLMLDNTHVIYEVSEEAEPKMEYGKPTQKIDRRTQLPMWTVALYARGRASGKKWSAVMIITVLSTERPEAAEGEQVVPIDLQANPYISEKKDRNGNVESRTQEVSFSCTGLRLVNAPDDVSSLVGSAA